MKDGAPLALTMGLQGPQNGQVAKSQTAAVAPQGPGRGCRKGWGRRAGRGLPARLRRVQGSGLNSRAGPSSRSPRRARLSPGNYRRVAEERRTTAEHHRAHAAERVIDERWRPRHRRADRARRRSCWPRASSRSSWPRASPVRYPSGGARTCMPARSMVCPAVQVFGPDRDRSGRGIPVRLIGLHALERCVGDSPRCSGAAAAIRC